MVDWNQAPEGAVDVRTDARGIDRFTDGTGKFYDSITRDWLVMRFDRHHWPVVEKRPAVPADFVKRAVDKVDKVERLQREVMTAVPFVQQPRNKYDREIIGKYGTGKCTVDVYRVLNAFGPLPPEIDHSIKKLLAPGKRGVKDERQDLIEAVQSIEARLQYLEACE